MQGRDALKKAFPVILLTVVVAICVTILTGVGGITLPRIEAMERERTLAMLSDMFPDMTRYDLEDGTYMIYADEDKIGHAFMAVGKGYGGNINILVGLEDEATIAGVAIISHSETSTIFTRERQDYLIAQLLSVNLHDMALRRDGGKIDAITGATTSFRAVVEAVRTTTEEIVEQLRGNE